MRLRILLLFLTAAAAWQFAPPPAPREIAERSGRPFDRPADAARFFMEQRAWPQGIPERWHERAMTHVHTMRRQGLSKAAAGWRWLSLGPDNIAGRIRAMAIDPRNASLVYAGSAGGGVWKSSDRGRSWRLLDELLPNLRIGAVAVDPFFPDRVFAGCGEGYVAWQGGAAYGRGIYATVDGGDSWQLLGSTDRSEFAYVFHLAFDPFARNVVYASTASGIYRSPDAGNTWTRVFSRPFTQFSAMVECSRTQPGVCYAGVEGVGVFRSSDYGVTWSGPLTNGIETQSFTRVVVAAAPSNGNVVYAALTATDEQCAGVFRSTDGGASWSRVSTPRNELNGNTYMGFQGRYNSTLTVHPTNANVVWVGGIDLHRSTDGGASWKQMSNWYRFQRYPYVHADVHAIIFDPYFPETLLVGTDGGLFVTSDGGGAFVEYSAGMVTVQFHSGTPHPQSDMVIGGTIDNGTLRTMQGDGWSDVTGGDGGHTAIDPVEPRIMYGELYYLHFLKSTNFGRSFYLSMTGIPRARDFGTSDRVAFIAPFLLSPGNPRTLYAGTYRVFRSSNAAESWSAISGNLAGDGYISALGLSAADANVVYTGASRGHIHVTTDGGADWTRVDGTVPDRYVTDFAVRSTDARRVLVALSGFSGGHLYYSSDAGGTWADLSGSGTSGLPDVPANTVFWHPEDESTIYVGTDVGLFVTTDFGQSWMVDNNGVGNVIISDLQLRTDGVLFMATHGRGMYRSSRSILASSESPPLRAVVGQNYPNPVSLSTGYETVLPYTLTEEADVRITVHDAAGRRVLNRHLGHQAPGDYRLPFDVRGLTSGLAVYRVYLNRIQAGEKNMLVIR
ncbi:MAG: hypothetical protein M5R41_00905 [Bacteroidia bacterium]|nr:hypothetical protein [Bacteroidia bacterium]